MIRSSPATNIYMYVFGIPRKDPRALYLLFAGNNEIPSPYPSSYIRRETSFLLRAKSSY